MENYTSLSVPFSRGCPFQCEFCDIITIYGRTPRTKARERLLAELDVIRRGGWRKQVFIVDDNFIGNPKRALELAHDLEAWQERHQYPFIFYTEASIDLAQREELIDAMARANFFYVFIGVETPDADALREAKKFQNLRRDPLDCIHFIQRRGLWVTAGFIVGFDSDTGDIFDRQADFIERAAIPWAMTGFLQAPPTTPLFDRMMREGRLIETSQATSNFQLTEFHDAAAARGAARWPAQHAAAYLHARGVLPTRHSRARILEAARTSACAAGVVLVSGPGGRRLDVAAGCVGGYRLRYWRFLGELTGRWARDRRKLYLGFVILVSAHHFIRSAADVASDLEQEMRTADR